MKIFRVYLIALLALVSSICLAAPDSWGTAGIWSLRDNTYSQVATYKVAVLHDAFGRKGFDLDLLAFGGANVTQSGAVTAGFAATRRFALAREITADIGLYGRAQADRRFDVGIYAGFRFSL